MPDTSKMSPQEYKAFTGKMSFPAGLERGGESMNKPLSDLPFEHLRLLDKERIIRQYEQSRKRSLEVMTERAEQDQYGPIENAPLNGEREVQIFKHGQTVWRKYDGAKVEVVERPSGFWGKDGEDDLVFYDAAAFQDTEPGKVFNDVSTPQRSQVISMIEEGIRELRKAREDEIAAQRSGDLPGFKPGQTVWNRHTHEMFDIVAVDRSSHWCWSVSRGHYETIAADDLVATDPRKTIDPPQHCPFCGHEAAVLERPTASRVQCNAMTCDFSGPGRQNRLKAIEAWNSIHVQSTAPEPKS